MHTLKTISTFLLLVFITTGAWGQEPKATIGPFAIINVDIYPVVGDQIEEGTILIQGDRISGVGKDLDIPDGFKVIDGQGLRAYPGMIDSGTGLGLREIGAVSLTNDRNEVGDFTPHMKALTAVNPNSILIPVNRAFGVTTVLSLPNGGTWPGAAALIHLHGYTPQAMFAGFEGMVLEFPRFGKTGWWDDRDENKIKKDDEEKLKKFQKVWTELKRYAEAKAANLEPEMDYNPEMQALLPVYRGEQTLLVKVDRRGEILKALDWIEENEIDNVVLMGVKEGWKVADSIAQKGIPVIVGPIQTNPGRNHDPYDSPYTNAGILQKAGVLLAIQTTEEENIRNLPFHAGFAAAYGLGREEALRAITINPAKIFGLEDQIGSIEVGKVANLFLCTGDPFEPKTQVEYLLIKGQNVPIENRQSRLYDEFLDRGPKN